MDQRSYAPRSRFMITSDTADGPYRIVENDQAVLQYNHATVQPGELLKGIAQSNLIYARPRGDYIHPLYGPNGEVLTRDWCVDHPHHRGIYWAWPEVQYRGELGDLHALQKVFARPVGDVATTVSPSSARIAAESEWRWEDKEPIVHERAIITAHAATSAGRLADLTFIFQPLVEGVSLARRGMAHYGGLNMRMNTVEGRQIVVHTDPPEAKPRMAWAEMSGRFGGCPTPAGVAVLQSAENPEYPGDWVQFPEIDWFQPTFPTAGTRYPLNVERTLTLSYRLWIHSGGKSADAACAEQWRIYNRRSEMGG
jgi:hypothetical protein